MEFFVEKIVGDLIELVYGVLVEKNVDVIMWIFLGVSYGFFGG